MPSLILISLYLIVCLIVLGLTESISDTHYKWLERFGFWGYAIFPAVMLTWATLVILECPELAWAGFGIYYVAIFCMFDEEDKKHIGVIHYLGAAWAIIYLMYVVWLWSPWLVLSFLSLSGFTLFSKKYKTYIIEVLAIITLYLYFFYS